LTREPRVKFSEGSVLVNSALAAASPINDLCIAIHNADPNLSLGYLKGRSHAQYHFDPPNSLDFESQASSIATVTLKELLEGHPRAFPRQKRLAVAASLASSMIQLQNTSWMTKSWGKRDIFFRKIDQTIIFEKPYITAEFLSTPPSTSSEIHLSSGPPAARDPSYIKASLESLGIVLIELCFGEPIESSSHKVQLRCSDDQPNHDFCLAIANAWTEEEILYEDPEFASPIDNCLRFPDISRIRKGRYDELLTDIYLSVIKPLQDEVVRRQVLVGGLG